MGVYFIFLALVSSIFAGKLSRAESLSEHRDEGHISGRVISSHSTLPLGWVAIPDPTHQIRQLGQWPDASIYDALLE